jgi:5-methylcytosine-specific restriction endonuclease McrA
MRISSETDLFRCSACGAYKPSGEFSFSDEARRSLNSYCRKCHAAYRHAHYLANKPDYIRRAIAQVNGRREQNRREIMTYLASHPCVDCGAKNVIVLEFDHRDPRDKLANVGTMMVSKRWARVRAEIEKCDVRCVNCHRRKTARDFRWLKIRSAP